jgi:hypothetical protein
MRNRNNTARRLTKNIFVETGTIFDQMYALIDSLAIHPSHTVHIVAKGFGYLVLISRLELLPWDEYRYTHEAYFWLGPIDYHLTKTWRTKTLGVTMLRGLKFKSTYGALGLQLSNQFRPL